MGFYLNIEKGAIIMGTVMKYKEEEKNKKEKHKKKEKKYKIAR